MLLIYPTTKRPMTCINRWLLFWCTSLYPGGLRTPQAQNPPWIFFAPHSHSTSIPLYLGSTAMEHHHFNMPIIHKNWPKIFHAIFIHFPCAIHDPWIPWIGSPLWIFPTSKGITPLLMPSVAVASIGLGAEERRRDAAARHVHPAVLGKRRTAATAGDRGWGDSRGIPLRMILREYMGIPFTKWREYEDGINCIKIYQTQTLMHLDFDFEG